MYQREEHPRLYTMSNCLPKIRQFEAYWEKKDNKCVSKCQVIIMALHIVATIFPKPHFIHHAWSTYIKIAYWKLTILQFKSPKMKELGNSILSWKKGHRTIGLKKMFNIEEIFHSLDQHEHSLFLQLTKFFFFHF